MHFVQVSCSGHLLSGSGLEFDPLTVLLLSPLFAWGMVGNLDNTAVSVDFCPVRSREAESDYPEIHRSGSNFGISPLNRDVLSLEISTLQRSPTDPQYNVNNQNGMGK